MRLSICTVAATLFVGLLAAPTTKFDNSTDTAEEPESRIVRRDGGDNKYFHEPGYVIVNPMNRQVHYTDNG